MYLYHYTSIENLALILKNKTIRFTRLDCVDDVEESSVYENTVPMGKYTFVSCWTESEEESIPLWNMYTPQMRGVRIKMNSSDLFFKYKIEPGTYLTSGGSVTINDGFETYTPFYLKGPIVTILFVKLNTQKTMRNIHNLLLIILIKKENLFLI